MSRVPCVLSGILAALRCSVFQQQTRRGGAWHGKEPRHLSVFEQPATEVPENPAFFKPKTEGYEQPVMLDFIRAREGERPTYPEALDMAEIQLARTFVI